MVRVGVKFEEMPHASQLALDRYIFDRLRQEARGRRHLRGMRLPRFEGTLERRQARRVPALDLELRLLPTDEQALPLAEQARLVAGGQEPAAIGPVQLTNISATGCGFRCAAETAPAPGSWLELRISGVGIALGLRGLVVYVMLDPP